MEIKPIRNEIDYKNAIERLESIFDAKDGTDECDELEILSILIENYESEKYPIEIPGHSCSQESKIDKYHYHEMLDRLSLFMNIIDSELLDHPVATRAPELAAKILQASEALHEAYQMAGELRFYNRAQFNKKNGMKGRNQNDSRTHQV